jgi:adenine deaminase
MIEDLMDPRVPDRKDRLPLKKKVRLLQERIAVARGQRPADLVLKSGKVVNVFTGEVQECDVAVQGGLVVGLGAGYRGREEVDVRRKWVAPGLMDAHFHIESSMLLPSGLAPALLRRGTTVIVSDPHEIANVMGLEGVRFMLRESQGLPLDIYFMAPSCVPATHLETAGARLGASELRALRKEPRVLGLAEVMNYPGVLAGDPEVLEKLAVFQDRPRDGHAPDLSGRDLQAYLTAGITSDHETFDPKTGLEKVQGGMMLMIREGTSAKNLEELLPLVTERNASRFCFVSDDLHPRDLLHRGHLDFAVRKAIQCGMGPVTAIRLASYNPARHFGLSDRGAVAPGYRADLVVLDDLQGFAVDRVYKDGRLVFCGGELRPALAAVQKSRDTQPLRVGRVTPDSFRVAAGRGKARIIEMIPGQILTRARYEEVRSEGGWVTSDPGRDILKLAVVERHLGSGRIGRGLVRGFGIRKGALASSVAHDSHNVIAAGVSDRELCRAVEEVRDMGGGMVAVDGERVLARLPLPVAGLMSPAPLEELALQQENLERAARSLGCAVPEPYMQLSFLALPVIPELKLTDMGLVDVAGFKTVPLFAEEGVRGEVGPPGGGGIQG